MDPAKPGEPLVDDTPVIQAGLALLRVMERRAKYLGLDAPTKSRVEVITEDVVDAEMAVLAASGGGQRCRSRWYSHRLRRSAASRSCGRGCGNRKRNGAAPLVVNRGVSSPAPSSSRPPGTWLTWIYMAGRGAGKSRAAAEWVHERAVAEPGCSIALVGRTPADVRDVMIEGDCGILTIAKDERPVYQPTKRRVAWPNGSTAHTYSC